MAHKNPDVSCDVNPGVSDALPTVNKYRCPYCKLSFWGPFGKQYYYEHLFRHTGKQMFRCQVCERRYGLKCHLIRHLFLVKQSPCLALTKSSKDTEKLECKVCAQTFTDKDDFVLHIFDHESSSCGESDDTTPGAQSAPTLRVPRSLSTFLCSKCGELCGTSEDQRLHKDYCKMEPVECPEYGKIYTSNAGMGKHGSNIHSDVKPFLCHICGWQSSHSFSMKYHLRVHAGIKKYECHDCGLKFMNQSRLLMHVVRHTGEKRYECQECSKKFFTKKELKAHSFKHSGIKEFECQFCGKKFAWKQNRESHLRVHSRKAFKCDNCGQEFTKKSALTRHMLTHAGTECFDGEEC